MARGVNCEVTTCAYNGGKNTCEAKEISVCNMNCNSAKGFKETGCSTFKLK